MLTELQEEWAMSSIFLKLKKKLISMGTLDSLGDGTQPKGGGSLKIFKEALPVMQGEF